MTEAEAVPRIGTWALTCGVQPTTLPSISEIPTSVGNDFAKWLFTEEFYTVSAAGWPRSIEGKTFEWSLGDRHMNIVRQFLSCCVGCRPSAGTVACNLGSEPHCAASFALFWILLLVHTGHYMSIEHNLNYYTNSTLSYDTGGIHAIYGL